MAFQVDFLPVGSGEKSGDRIVFRIFDLTTNEQKVFVIDGGFNDTADELVQHINKYYGTNKVDYVICSHPDSDHSAGLQTVLEKMEVENFLTHLPWEHADDIKSKIKNNISNVSLENRLEKNLKTVSDLEDLAIEKGAYVVEPFAGLEILNGKIKILGPSREYYQELLPHFDDEINPKKDLSLLGMVIKVVGAVAKWVKDHPLINLLDDEDATSVKNNSSTVILLEDDGKKVLFTGDVGKRGLERAIEYAKTQNIDLNDLYLFDVPHHGSKRNLGKTAMSQIGSSLACISASDNDKKHPAKKVTNHLKKMGMKWTTTEDCAKCFPSSDIFGAREGWGPIAYSEEFHDDVEE